MKISFIRYSLLNRGGDRVVIEYANYLVDRGHEVKFYIDKFDTIFDINPSVELNHIPLPTRIGTLLYGLIKDFDSDIVIVDIIHLSLFVGVRNNVIYLAQAHDTEYYKNRFVRLLIKMLYFIFLRLKKGCVISDSEVLSKTLQDNYGATKVITATTGIDMDKFYCDPDPDLVQQKGERKSIFILSRGDHYRKGFDITINVLKKLCVDFKDRLEVWVCGDELYNNILPCTTRYLGSPEDNVMRRILSSADIFLYPSRYEGFGLFPLEAMACGCLVITTPAVPYVTDGYNAIVVPIGDDKGLVKKISETINSRIIDSRILHNAYETAKQFDIRKSKEKFEAALLEVKKFYH